MFNINKIKKILIIIFLVIFSSFFLIGITLGIYFDKKEKSYGYSSGNIYVSSNFLAEETVPSYYFRDYDYRSVPIEFNNFKNDFLITNYPINYSISCSTSSSNYSCNFNDINSTITNSITNDCSCSKSGVTLAECLNNNGTFSCSKYTNISNLNINKINQSLSDESLVVDVILTVTSPYKKELKGKFYFYFTDKTAYEVNVSDKYHGVTKQFNCIYYIKNNYHDNTFNFTVNGASAKVVTSTGLSSSTSFNIEKGDTKKVEVISFNGTNCNDISYTIS